MRDEYAIDGHKMVYHPERVAQWLNTGGDWKRARSVYPVYMEISPTGACNHRCNFCALDFMGHKPQRLSSDMLEERLPEIGAMGVKAVMFGGEGEPLLHPSLAEIIEMTEAAGMDAALTTNGVHMDERFIEKALQHLTWIKVSVNGGTSENYARIHHCPPEDFQTVLHNLRKAASWKKANHLSCTIGAQILLLPETASELRILAEICRDDLGIDYLVVKPFSQNPLSISHRYQNLDYQEYLHFSEELEGLNTEAFSVIFRARTMIRNGQEKKYRVCHSTPFFWAYLMATGDLYSCSAYLNDPRFRLGNLYKQGFKKVWEGSARRKNCALLLNGFDVSSCRQTCRMDAINEYLWRIKNPDPHDRFI